MTLLLAQYLKAQDPFSLSLFLATVHVLGIALFARGLLLTRVELGDVSPCADPVGMGMSSGGSDGCWSRSRFRKVVIIIVDALRLDFLLGGGNGGVHVERLPRLMKRHKDSVGAGFTSFYVQDCCAKGERDQSMCSRRAIRT